MAVGKRGKSLVIDFRFHLPDGRKVRAAEYEGPITKENEKRVKSKWRSIQYELKHGKFDYLRYFPNGAKAKYLQASSDMPFDKWWTQFIKEKTVRSVTIYEYQLTYGKHIGPYFGHAPIGTIDEQQVILFRKHLLSKGLQENTINTYLKPLCQALRLAMKRRLIADYPCEEIGRLKEPKPDINPLSFEELTYWLDVLEKKDLLWHDLIFFWSRTGLRPGELYALQWKHVDYFNAKLLVRQTRLHSGGIGPPKTESSIRDVDLRPAVIDVLKRQEERTGLMNSWIWLKPNSRQWTQPDMNGKFRHYLRLAGLPSRPPKQMRHTFATLHIAAGESITWVSKMLGHSDVNITLNKYNRFIPNLTREDGSAFEKIMDRKKGFGNNMVMDADK